MLKHKTSLTLLALLLISLAFYPGSAEAVKFPYFGTEDGLMPCMWSKGIPCTSWCQVLILIQNIIYLALTLTLLIFVPFKLLWGGVKIMTSGGSQTRYDSGKKTIKSILMVILVTFLSWAAIGTILSFLALNVAEGDSKVKVSWPDIECVPAVIEAEGSRCFDTVAPGVIGTPVEIPCPD